jgi:hypothetical protein
MAAVGVHVELTVRQWRGVEGFHSIFTGSFECCTSRVRPRDGFWALAVLFIVALVLCGSFDAVGLLPKFPHATILVSSQGTAVCKTNRQPMMLPTKVTRRNSGLG